MTGFTAHLPEITIELSLIGIVENNARYVIYEPLEGFVACHKVCLAV